MIYTYLTKIAKNNSDYIYYKSHVNFFNETGQSQA